MKLRYFKAPEVFPIVLRDGTRKDARKLECTEVETPTPMTNAPRVHCIRAPIVFPIGKRGERQARALTMGGNIEHGPRVRQG